MGTFQNHKKLYLTFKKDAENDENSKPTCAELFFLSLFHLIEACAAKNRVHINKHKSVRRVLEENVNIFKNQTEKVWRFFQKIENKLRPKFSYGFSWNDEDFDDLKTQYFKLEAICLKVIENGA